MKILTRDAMIAVAVVAVAILIYMTYSQAQAAHFNKPSCVPAYIKTHNNAAVSMLFLPPLLILNVMGHIGDAPNGGENLRSLTCTTLAVAKSASGRKYRRD